MRRSIRFVAQSLGFLLTSSALSGCGGSDGSADQKASGGASGRANSTATLGGGPGSTVGGASTIGSSVGGSSVNGGGSGTTSSVAPSFGGASSGGASETSTASVASAGSSVAQGGVAGATGAATGGVPSTAGASNLASPLQSFVVQSPTGIVDKMDILFSIDNSLSMGDKQQVLAAAVPQLLRRLTNPDCVDPTPGSKATPLQVADPMAACPAGMEREFASVHDIHIGIVSSGLGDFGGDTCQEEGVQYAGMNDHAWLIGALPRTKNALPMFLSWSKTDAAGYATELEPKLNDFRNLVSAVQETGCGNEMVLEAWYRFLVDPKPPTDVTMTDAGPNVRGPVDEDILKQRKAFLRPDSLVAVVMLSDENDCSMRDDDYAWVAMTAGSGFRMWRGSSVCATNPNDPCCYSCMLDAFASEACRALDTSCRQGDPGVKLVAADDDANMRCRSMKKRFGHDFLFPTTRYVNALTKLQLCPDQTYGDLDCDCAAAKAKGLQCAPGVAVPNPLYQNLDSTYVPTGPARFDASSVFLAAIVGVPWQDLASDAALTPNSPLEYRLATELNWELFAPKDDVTPPLDPMMIEQAMPRTGTHPITLEPLAPPESSRLANSINGHEYYSSDKDVQFACIFSLEQPISSGGGNATRVCDFELECGADDGSDAYKVCARRFDGCACTQSPISGSAAQNPLDPRVSLSPVCQKSDGTYGNTQFFAKAYPGLRELQVLRGFYEASQYSANNAIAASICPKDLNFANAASAGYGYNPAMRALVDRLKDNIGGTCLPQPLVADASSGKVPCGVIEAITPEGAAKGSCECEAKQRDNVDATTRQSMIDILQSRGACSGADCDKFCFCGLRQLLPGTAAGDSCLNDVNAARTSPAPGFCYVNPPSFGNAALVAGCAATEKRTIRIVGNDAAGLGAPAIGPVYYTCSGSPFTSDGLIRN